MSAAQQMEQQAALDDAWQSSDDLDADLAQLRSLVEADEVEAARALAPKILDRWPDSPRAQHWARVLEPPKVTVLHGHPNESYETERQWLKQHRREYPGCWLAVKGDRLLIADPDLGRVYQKLAE